MELPQTRVSRTLDRLINRIGETVSWLWIVLLTVIIVNVVLRYAFDQGRVEFEEIQWHLYAIGFLLGLSYGYCNDSHIRVDLLRPRFGVRVCAWIELYGTIFLLIPFIALVVIYSFPFVASSYHLDEISQAPGGLPLRWLIKAMLPCGFLMLLLAVISRLTRVWTLLFGVDEGLRGSE